MIGHQLAVLFRRWLFVHKLYPFHWPMWLENLKYFATVSSFVYFISGSKVSTTNYSSFNFTFLSHFKQSFVLHLKLKLVCFQSQAP